MRTASPREGGRDHVSRQSWRHVRGSGSANSRCAPRPSPGPDTPRWVGVPVPVCQTTVRPVRAEYLRSTGSVRTAQNRSIIILHLARRDTAMPSRGTDILIPRKSRAASATHTVNVKKTASASVLTRALNMLPLADEAYLSPEDEMRTGHSRLATLALMLARL